MSACDCYISPGCGNGWHCETCLRSPLLHAGFWRRLMSLYRWRRFRLRF